MNTAWVVFNWVGSTSTEWYWTGDVKESGTPCRTKFASQARHFPNADVAYRMAASFPKLHGWRVGSREVLAQGRRVLPSHKRQGRRSE